MAQIQRSHVKPPPRYQELAETPAFRDAVREVFAATGKPPKVKDLMHVVPVTEAGLPTLGQTMIYQARGHVLYGESGGKPSYGKERHFKRKHPDTAPGVGGVGQNLEVERDEDTFKINGRLEVPAGAGDATTRTYEKLVRECAVDLSVWESTWFKCKKWDFGIKRVDTDDEGNQTSSIDVKELFAVSATFKRRKVIVAVREELRDLIAEARGAIRTWAPVAYPGRGVGDNPHLYVISIFDHHFGKYAAAAETGADYDMDIAESLYNRALDHLLRAAAGINVERFLFPIGNDMLNVDNLENTTTGGTQQTQTGRHHINFRRVRQLLCDRIGHLRTIAPVDVVVVPGNHDFMSAFFMGDSLECFFHSCPNVNVDNRPVARKYYRYHNVLLGLTHGKEEKRAGLGGLMAAEAPRMWGETQFRQWLIGHLHGKTVDEQHGVEIHMMPSLCAPEDWHKLKGYVGNVRSAIGQAWSRADGLTADFYFNLKPEATD